MALRINITISNVKQ